MGATPLNIYQYNQDAGATGGEAAAGGLAGLAGAIVGNPQQLAQARYLGAGTAQETAAAAAQQADNQAVQQFDAMAQDPSNLSPGGIQKMLALAGSSPTLSARASGLINSMLAAHAAAGDGVASVPQASDYAALSGNVPMANTPTGYSAGLANAIQQANIGAGATLGAAGIAAGAAEKDTQAQIAANEAMTTMTVSGPNGPTVVRAIDAPGMAAYDSATANTAAQANDGYGSYIGPGGNVILRTAEQAAQENLAPAPANTNEAQAHLFAGATSTPNPAAANPAVPAGGLQNIIAPVQQASLTPPPGVTPAPQTPTGAPGPAPGNAPGAGAAQTSSLANAIAPQAAPQTPTGGAPPPVQGPATSISPEQRDAIIQSTLSQMSGEPLPDATNPQQAAQMDQIITQRLTKQSPGVLARYAPSQALLDPIRLQAAWLYQHDPSARGNMDAAITQAMMNVTGAQGQNVAKDLHILAPGPSQLQIADPTKIAWPPGMPIPQQFQMQGQSAAPGVPGMVPAQPSAANAFRPPSQGQAAAASAQAGLSPQQAIMAEAQDRINQWENSKQPPAVIAAQINAIKQRLVQVGALPNLPPGTPH